MPSSERATTRRSYRPASLKFLPMALPSLSNRPVPETPTVDENGRLTEAEMIRIRETLSRVPFARLLGIELEEAEPGSATLRLNVRDELRQIHGVVHGGAIASLIDTATAFAIVTLLEDKEKFSTVDLMVNYLRPLEEGTVTAKARVLRAGRRLITVSADVFDDGGNLAATALSTYLRLA